MSAPQQAIVLFSSLFYSYVLIVSLQIANKHGIKKKEKTVLGT
jgi:hypothetical protein